MIHRSFDAERLNQLANNPIIRPYLGGDPETELDLTDFVNEPKNVVLLGEHGGFLFAWTAPYTFEVHVMLLPEGRGSNGYQLALEALARIQEFGAGHIWARIRPEYKHLRHFTRAAGFTPCGIDVLDLGTGPVTYNLFHWRKCPCHQ